MLLEENDVKQLEKKYRLNLINSITGIKPANLIGTRSQDGIDNVAIFSSVVHLGSNPAQLGFVMRPQTNSTKDTYSNIISTGFYTINHVARSFIKQAHYTSAKLEKETSEFDKMNLKREFIGDFFAPFVEPSPVKIGMKLIDQIKLPNQCLFIVGSIHLIQLPDKLVNDYGQLELELEQAAGIGGLNSYYALKKLTSYPYVRINEIPDFNV